MQIDQEITKLSSAEVDQKKFWGVGSALPDFCLEATVPGKALESSKMTQAELKGNWTVLFSWPFNFTFVCPTEVLGFNELVKDFQKLDCTLIGMSIDSIYAHYKWIEELGTEIKFPFLSDVKRDFGKALGILDSDSGAMYRATFIIDPKLKVRSMLVNDLSVGRNPNETLRTLEALQTDKLCGCNWQPGQKTLS